MLPDAASRNVFLGRAREEKNSQPILYNYALIL
jgi:hypothetical protein